MGDCFSFLIRGNEIEEIGIPDGVREHYIYQVIGEEKINVRTYERQLQEGDHVILSTDGMMASLSNKDVLDIVIKRATPELVVNSLVEEIKKKPRIYKGREYRDDIGIIDVLLIEA